MSDLFDGSLGVVLILAALYAVLLIIYFIQRRLGKRAHRYDERYYKINDKGKSKSWDTMLIVYLMAWPIVIIFDGISFSFFLLTALYVLHNMSLIITNTYYLKKYG